MRYFIVPAALLSCLVGIVRSADVRLVELNPPEAQQIIDQHDTALRYAPKIDANVPAVRYLGNEPHNVLEDVYLANQYHGQDGLGGYLYGYGVPDIAKTERKQAGGDLRGAYNYVSGNGQEIKVEYWDDGTGFHQVDNVPKVLPQQIDDLPEVKAAKDDHLRLWQELAERNSRPIENPYDSQGGFVQGRGPLSAEEIIRLQQASGFQERPHYQPPANPAYFPQPQQPNQYQPPQQAIPAAYSPYQPQPSGSQQYPQLQPVPQTGFPPNYNTLIHNNPQQPVPSALLPPKEQYPNPSVQYQGDQQAQINYNAAKAINREQHALPQGQSSQYTPRQTVPYGNGPQLAGNESQDDGSYDESQDAKYAYKEGQDEEGDKHGPPKGFFYNFDYPVGVVVKKQGSK